MYNKKIMNHTKSRQEALQGWLRQTVNAPFELQSMTPGAGHRRYFRVTTASECFVVMDTVPDEKWIAFIQLTPRLASLGIRTPQIYAADREHGFLLLTDFGSQLYEQVLTTDNADSLYRLAFAALLRLQSYSRSEGYSLKPFDMVHYREKMSWLVEFFCRRYLNVGLTARQAKECDRLFDLLINTAMQQPKTAVHYDYHCRNLILLPNQEVGVLDFQDAVHGPITYDLMSLLRDCYIDWPASRVMEWLLSYQRLALASGILRQEDPSVWTRWCDFSSAQRHIKCIGLFARFHVQGHSSDYLAYIPRLLSYLRDISARYAEMAKFAELLEGLPR